jgi:hypothetical protein
MKDVHVHQGFTCDNPFLQKTIGIFGIFNVRFLHVCAFAFLV